jgi:hypothetical protein
VVDGPSPTPTTTNQDQGEATVEGEVASMREPPRRVQVDHPALRIIGDIEVRYHFLRDNIEKGKITLNHVPTHDQLADIFTKPLDQATFTRLRGGAWCLFDFLSWCVGAPL